MRKDIKQKSVALFDDDIFEAEPKKEPVKKSTKKSTKKKNDISVTKRRSSSGGSGNTADTGKQKKKKGTVPAKRKTGDSAKPAVKRNSDPGKDRGKGGKGSGTPDSGKKPAAKTTRGTKATPGKGKQVKEGSKRPSGKSKDTRRAEKDTVTKNSEPRVDDKKVPTPRREKGQVYGELPGNQKIGGTPREVSSDPFLLDVSVGGKRMLVSKWSIIGDTYCPGLDSEFLVHRYNAKKKKD